jgi:hypothetical protein
VIAIEHPDVLVPATFAVGLGFGVGDAIGGNADVKAILADPGPGRFDVGGIDAVGKGDGAGGRDLGSAGGDRELGVGPSTLIRMWVKERLSRTG